jgi:stage II sporulation protein D
MIKEPQIKVGILSAESIQFSFPEAYASGGRLYKGDFSVSVHQQKIKMDDLLYEEMRFDPVAPDSNFELSNVVIGIGFHWERAENQRFKGSLILKIIDGKVNAINLLGVEDYLVSVISSEMAASSSLELLKTHAVISRSWLLKPILNPAGNQFRTPEATPEEIIRWYERDAHEHFDVCADDHCQRYQGITRISSEKASEAVAATAGMVLMYKNRICDARYYKCCGGATELFESCWADESHPYLSPVFDRPEQYDNEPDLSGEEQAETWILSSPEAFCNTSDQHVLSQVLNNYDTETQDFYRWKVEYSQDELRRLIKHKSGIDFGQIVSMLAVSRGPSARITALKITGTLRTVTVGKELEIRKWLSPSHLYSSAFVVKPVSLIESIPQKFIIRGAGWGHGVGLCQIGAAVMGEKGYTYEQILKHYFKHGKLEKIY